MDSFMRLFKLQIEVSWFHLVEWVKGVFRYYGNLTFALLDLTALLLSFWYNPFRLCRLYREQKVKEGENDVEHYTYGETPLTSMEKIVKGFNIPKGSRWLDMGSGRGRLPFFLSQVMGMRVTGVENVPTLYEISMKAYRMFKPQDVEFLLEDFFLTSFAGYEVIYLFGTTMSEEKVEFLTKRLLETPKGTKVITVSFPLDVKGFEVMNVIPIKFDFGETDVYLQVRV